MDSSMGVFSGLLPVIPLFIFLIFSVYADDSPALPNPENCFKRTTLATCGLPMEYPLEDGNVSSNSCGYPGFEVACNPSIYGERTFINISNSIYRVISIDYKNKSISLVDIGVDGISCPQPKRNFSFPSSPPWVNYHISIKRNITIFSNCSSNRPADANDHLLCGDGNNTSTSSYAFYSDKITNASYWYGNCAKNVVVPVTQDLPDYNPRVVMNLGFYMGWSATDWCEECERSGGQCWSSSLNNSTGCACQNNKSYNRTCPPEWCEDCERSGGQCSLSTLRKSPGCACKYGKFYDRTCPPPQPDPAKFGLRSAVARRLVKIDKFCGLDDSAKRKICHRLPLARRLFHGAALEVRKVSGGRSTAETPLVDCCATSDIAMDVGGSLPKKAVSTGSTRANILAGRRSVVAAASSIGGRSKLSGASVPEKQVANQEVGGGSPPPTKRSKVSDSIIPKLVDCSGRKIPGDMSAFEDNDLIARLMRVIVLPRNYARCVECPNADQREVLDMLRYRVCCLKVAEQDVVELRELEIRKLKGEVADAIASKEELEQAKAETEKLALEAELARESLAKELERVKVKNTDLLKASQAAAGERERLNEVMKQADLGRRELVDATIEAETDVEVKDAYIRHLAYLLEPQLSLLPAEVVDDIKGLPARFDVEVVP